MVKNNNRCNQQKFAHAAHCFSKLSYVSLLTFFLHFRSCSPCIGGRQHFSFSYRRHKIFMLFYQQKMSPLFFYLSLQISVALFLVEPRWPAAYFLFFLSLFLAVYSKSVDMTVNLNSVLQKTRIQREFPLSVSVFIESSVVSASQRAGSYMISRQHNIELHLG